MQFKIKHALLAVLLILIVIQFVPVKRDNPPSEPAQAVESVITVPAAVHSILERSCADCHSNRTRWPWYSQIAPVSWLVAHDVHEGRVELNLSEWATYSEKRKTHKLQEICEQLRGGKMPDSKYTLIHRDARLTHEDRDAVCAWADATRKSMNTAAGATMSVGAADVSR
jgi:hypothetical protein